MIVYRCDRCGRDMVLDGERWLSLDIEPRNNRCFSGIKHYLLCEECSKRFENFMNGLEVVAP